MGDDFDGRQWHMLWATPCYICRLIPGFPYWRGSANPEVRGRSERGDAIPSLLGSSGHSRAVIRQGRNTDVFQRLSRRSHQTHPQPGRTKLEWPWTIAPDHRAGTNRWKTLPFYDEGTWFCLLTTLEWRMAWNTRMRLGFGQGYHRWNSDHKAVVSTATANGPHYWASVGPQSRQSFGDFLRR
jgi:hypothetical protein